MSLLQKKKTSLLMAKGPQTGLMNRSGGGLLGNGGASGSGSVGSAGPGPGTTGELVWSFPLWTKAS